MRHLIIGLAAVVALINLSSAFGAVVEFVPHNDPAGSVARTNDNDGYDRGRGIVFEMAADVIIDSIGIYHDLNDASQSFEVARTVTTSGEVTSGQTVLRSGTASVSTNGLQWIDYAIEPLTLQNGNSYHIEFTHMAKGNQNFYYRNSNYRFSQDAFQLLDGTMHGHTNNTVIPAIRVNVVAVPEPSTFTLLCMGAFGFLTYGWRKRK